MTEETPKERILDGLGVAPGIGIGVAHIREAGSLDIPEYRVPAARVAAERQRLREAVTRARRQIGRLRSKARNRARVLTDTAADEVGYLLDAYFHMLKDSRLLRGADGRIAEGRVNAEAAVHAELMAIIESFQAMNDPYLAARVDDIREVGNRLLRQLMKTPTKPFPPMPKGCVVVADELTPADAAQINPERVGGIATATGGVQSHTAIMARALGLPAVLGVPGLLAEVRPGDQLLVDGDMGQIVVNPTPESVAAFKRQRSERLREKRRLIRLAKQPAVTRDGIEVTLLANVELPLEMANVADAGAAGIGLLRTEFLFMNQQTMPGEDQQYVTLRDMVERAEGRPVTVRTLDMGGDKAAFPIVGDARAAPASPLGMRGIRHSLFRPDILETQFRAILRAGAHGPVRVLLPMVTGVGEVRAARRILARAARRLIRRGAQIPDALPPVGAMIEVPAAALAADALAQVSDFFAIGSNDLTMFALAIDRTDEQVAHLYDPLHPAVLRLMQFSAAAAMRSRIPVSICGEIAGDPRFTALLLGLGFRTLSMTAARIPAVKNRIREVDLLAAERRARLIMEQVDPDRIKAFVDEFNARDPSAS